MTYFVLRLWRKRPYPAVGWLWFLGTLVPVIGLVQVGGQSMADRYMYLPMIGLLIMLAWTAADLRANLSSRLLAAAAIVGCLVVSRAQLRFWSSGVRLFEHALAVTAGSAIAHDNLGIALLTQGQTNQALAHFSAALQLDPGDDSAFGNVGTILLGQGKTEEALAKYQQGLQLNPNSPDLNLNLGICLDQQGKAAAAIPYYLTALRLKPDYRKLTSAWVTL